MAITIEKHPEVYGNVIKWTKCYFDKSWMIQTQEIQDENYMKNPADGNTKILK